MGAVPSFAGLPLNQPRLMGVVNVTPDSFSDGGDFLTHRWLYSTGLNYLTMAQTFLMWAASRPDPVLHLFLLTKNWRA